MDILRSNNQRVSGGELPQNKGVLRIRAYCSKCGKLLQESTMMSKKQLLVAWDRAVLGAAGIKCDDCGTKFPNFDINLMIYNVRLDREYEPTKYIKLPKRRETPDQLFTSLAKKWKQEHPNITAEDARQGIEEARQELAGDRKVSSEEAFKLELEKRSKYYDDKGHE